MSEKQQHPIPKEMRAARVLEKGQSHYSLETIAVPTPKPGQALLRTGAAGFCHTDLMVMNGELGGEKYPVTGSHEPVGTVVALGEQAEKDGNVKVGDRVVGFLHVDVCHKCKDCTEYDWRYCPNSKYAGINTDGGFAEYVAVDADKCVAIPDDLSFQQAAPLTCAGITIHSAIRKCNLKKGEILAISGLGALGHLGVQIAKALDITVVGIDTRPEPLELARTSKLAPDLLIDAGKTSAEEAVKQIRKLRPDGYKGWDAPWDGVDAFILTSDPKESQKYGMDILRRHGLYMVVSQPPTVEFEFHNFVFKDITVVGSLHGNKTQMQELIDLVGRYPIRSEVAQFRLDEHEKMVDGMHDAKRKGKTVMVFDA